jgi:DNA polymerase III subunit delta'
MDDVDAATRGEAEAPHPRETGILLGHEAAEQGLLAAYRSGRIPHAFLIGGPQGIGKATLAYRMARFVFAHPDPLSSDVQSAADLSVPADNPAARRVTARAHPDLLSLERGLNESGKPRKTIPVEDVRRIVTFFGSTAGEGGWRIAIVDSVDELNAEGENALLKILEEPPPRSLLFLISHSPGSVRATLRSRCRRLALRSLPAEEVLSAAAHALDRNPDDDRIAAAAALAEGSVARAISFLDGDTLAVHEQVSALLRELPALNPQALHALGDALGGTDQRALDNVISAINGWLSAQLAAHRNRERLARIAQVSDEINRAAREAAIYNLDRKPLIFQTFDLLAEAARG